MLAERCAARPTGNEVDASLDRQPATRTHTPGGDPAAACLENLRAWYTAPTRRTSREISPGPPGGAPQLPDDGHRTSRASDTANALDARRVDGGRRGDDARSAASTKHAATDLLRRRATPTRRPIAVARRAGRADRHRAGGRADLDGPSIPHRPASARCSSTRAPTGVVRDLTGPIAAVHAAGGLGGRGHRPPGLHAARAAGRAGRRRRRRLSRSASACPSATAAPRRLPRHPRRPRAARCPAASSACRSTPPAAPPYRLALPDPRAAHPPGEGDVEHLHRAGAPGRHRRRCTPCTTAPRAPRRIAERVHRQARCWPARSQAPASRSYDDFFDTLTVARRGRRRRAWSPAAAPPRCNVRKLDADTVGVAPRRDHRRRTSSPGRVARRVRSDGRSRRRHAGALPPRCASAPASTSPTPCSHAHRSETRDAALPRARLSDKDVALDRVDDPAGHAAPMKLNATTEMAAVTWPEFADAAPVRPARPGARATRDLITDLEALARRGHRVRRRVAPAQRRRPRASSPACWPSAATTRRGATAGPRRLPHPVVAPTAPTPRPR